MKRFPFTEELNKQEEPLPDIAICSQCGWRGQSTECPKEEEGDWESGYHMVDICPKCEDGGCIDDYDMSDEQLAKWEEWTKKKGKDYGTL